MGLEKESKHITEYTAVCDRCGITQVTNDEKELETNFVRYELWPATVKEHVPVEYESLRYHVEPIVSEILCNKCSGR